MLTVTGRVGRSIAAPRTDGALASLLDSAVPADDATRATVVSADGSTSVTVTLEELVGARIESGRLVGPSGPGPIHGPRPGGDEWVPDVTVGEPDADVLVDDVARIVIA